MKTITLPDDLNLNTSISIYVYVYESTKEIYKEQIILSKNTFSFVQEGKKEVVSENSSFAIDNSQFLLMKSGYFFMTEKFSNNANNYRSILFFFSSQAVLKFIRKFKLNSKGSKLYSVYSFNYDSFIKGFVDSLLAISKLVTSIQKKILEVKFEEIMLYLVEFKGINFLYSLINNSNNRSQRFIETMQRNQLNKLTIKELSFLTNMSVSTFKREFEKHFKSSPNKWFLEKRLKHAAFLLKNKSKRPSDIYKEIGYTNLSSFSNAFRVKFGISPKKYQQNWTFIDTF